MSSARRNVGAVDPPRAGRRWPLTATCATRCTSVSDARARLEHRRRPAQNPALYCAVLAAGFTCARSSMKSRGCGSLRAGLRTLLRHRAALIPGVRWLERSRGFCLDNCRRLTRHARRGGAPACRRRVRTRRTSGHISAFELVVARRRRSGALPVGTAGHSRTARAKLAHVTPLCRGGGSTLEGGAVACVMRTAKRSGSALAGSAAGGSFGTRPAQSAAATSTAPSSPPSKRWCPRGTAAPAPRAMSARSLPAVSICRPTSPAAEPRRRAAAIGVAELHPGSRAWYRETRSAACSG